jgi:hypothetical protein
LEADIIFYQIVTQNKSRLHYAFIAQPSGTCIFIGANPEDTSSTASDIQQAQINQASFEMVAVLVVVAVCMGFISVGLRILKNGK